MAVLSELAADYDKVQASPEPLIDDKHHKLGRLAFLAFEIANRSFSAMWAMGKSALGLADKDDQTAGIFRR